MRELALLLGVSVALGSAAAQPLPQEPFVIEETAPSGPAEDWCGTGRLPPEGYRVEWTRWRDRARDAEARGDVRCRGFALANLALLTERQDLGRFGVPYWEEARKVLEGVLPADDPRLARIELRLAHRRGLADDDRAREDSFRLSLRAADRLREAFALGDPGPPLRCSGGDGGASREEGAALPARPLVGDREEVERLLRDALFAVLRGQLGRKLFFDALETVGELEVLLESRTASTEDRWIDHQTARLAGEMARFPPGLVDPERIVRLQRLTAESGSRGEFSHLQSLEALADAHLAADRPGEAERVLAEAIEARDAYLDLHPERRIGDQDAARSNLVRRLTRILERQERWADVEALLLEEIRVLEERGEDPLSALRYLSYFYGNRGRLVEKEAVIRTIMTLEDPAASFETGRLARVLFEQGRLVEAEGEALRAHELLAARVEPSSSNLANSLELLGRIRRALGHEALAIETFREGVRVYELLDEEKRAEGERLSWISEVGRARLHLRAGDLDDAEAALLAADEALRIEALSGDPAGKLAVAASSAARIARVRAALRRRQERPADAGRLERLAERLCRETGREGEALDGCLGPVIEPEASGASDG